MADRTSSSRSLKKGTSSSSPPPPPSSRSTAASSVRTRSQTRRQGQDTTDEHSSGSRVASLALSSESPSEPPSSSSGIISTTNKKRSKRSQKGSESDKHYATSNTSTSHNKKSSVTGHKKLRSEDRTSANPVTVTESPSQSIAGSSSDHSSKRRRKESEKVESRYPASKKSKSHSVVEVASGSKVAADSTTTGSTVSSSSSSRRRSSRLTKQTASSSASSSTATASSSSCSEAQPASSSSSSKSAADMSDPGRESGRSDAPTASSSPAASAAHVAAAATAGSSSAGSSGTGDETDDSEMGRLQALLEARGLPPHIFGALGPRVQHLLHRSMGTSAASKGQQLVLGLQATGDEGQQLQSVMEMCQLLVMGNEDTLSGFPVKTAVPALVALLKMEHNFDIMNHAVRALTYMMESLPRSSAVVVEAIPAFLDKLQSIQCMDVAEQSLTALEMLSRRHSKNILHAHGVSACLTFIDFFSINAQRAALAITANCFQNLTPDEFPLVKESVPILSNHLNVQDKKCIESTCLAFSRLVDSFPTDADIVTVIAGQRLLTNLKQLLMVSPQVISTATFVMVVRMLSTMCNACPALAVDLLKLNIAETLRYLLLSPNSKDNSLDLAQRSPQEFYEIVTLVSELMPRLPTDGIFRVDSLLSRQQPVPVEGNWQWRDERGIWRSFDLTDNKVLESANAAGEDEVSLSSMGQNYLIDFNTMTQINEETGVSRQIQRRSGITSQSQAVNQDSNSPDPRSVLMTEQPDLIESFVKSLFGVLYEVYSNSAGPAVRHKCLQALLRVIYCAPTDLLQSVLKNQAVSRHIAAMLASPDLRIVVGAIQMANILMEKLPHVFSVFFKREGVMHQFKKLIEDDSKDNDCQVVHVSAGTSSSSSAMAVTAAAAPPPYAAIAADSKQTPAAADPFALVPDAPPPGEPSAQWSVSYTQRAAIGSSVSAISPSVPVTGDEKTAFTSRSGRKKVSSKKSAGHPVSRKRMETDAKPGACAVSSGSRAVSVKSSSSSISTRSHSDCEVSGEAGAEAPQPLTAAHSLPSTSSALTPALSDMRSLLTTQGSTTSSTTSCSSSSNNQPPGSRKTSKLGSVASKTGSFLSSLHPSRWGKWTSADRTPPHSSSSVTCRPASLCSFASEPLSATSARSIGSVNRDKVKSWVREQALEFEGKYFPSSNEDGMTTMNRLTIAVESFNRKEPHSAFEELKSVILTGDISPFELIHSGIVRKLLNYLTKSDDGCESTRCDRIRVFLSVFLGTPASNAVLDDEKQIVNLNVAPLSALVSKLNACISQLEQFPVRVHDVIGTGSGNVRGTSALKFFNTHQLKCNLQRHPSCNNLKQWRGGPVKIDPLALVQAIERYLVIRGYGRIRETDDDGSDDDNSDEDFDDNMAAMLLNQGQGRHKLQFYIGDHLLPYNMTVYQAIRQFGGSGTGADGHDTDAEHDGPVGHANMWIQTHAIYYRPYSETPLHSQPSCSSSTSQPSSSSSSGGGGSRSASNRRSGKTSSGKNSSPKRKDELWTEGKVPIPQSPVDELLDCSLPSTINVCDASAETIALLRCLYAISRYWGSFYQISRSYNAAVPQTEFVNAKLAAKANRQLQDPLVIMTGNLPAWLSSLAAACPFLFPFETRHLLFYVTCFDRDRALQRLLDSTPGLNSNDSSERVTPRLDRRKKTVTREDLLRQAEIVLQDVSSSKSLLEIQYQDEVGTGLGPTLEFYALVSQELRRADLDLWKGEAVESTSAASRSSGSGKSRASSSAAEIQLSNKSKDSKEESHLKYIYSPHGLFPQPLGRNVKPAVHSKVKSRFKLLGKFMAKALMDSRMVDIPLSVPFYKWLLGKENQLSICDMEHIDAEMARTLITLDAIAKRKALLMNNENVDTTKSGSLLFNGTAIEDLALDFTLPGYPNFEMRKGGKDMTVSLDNVSQYVNLLTHWTLFEGVHKQMEAFREGFEQVLPLSHLRLFYPEELETLFCGGSHMKWDVKMLLECCHADHGYTMESRAIKFLFEILSEYDEDEQRKFLQFVTGSPRLPVGGLKSLTPPLTIVRKTNGENDTGDSAEAYLPSVMTCVNYLKLPDYSSIETMRAKIRHAAQDGQNSFHLS